MQRERGTPDTVARAEKCLPKRVKQRRKVIAEDGSDSGQWEDHIQLVFPDDEAVQPHQKLLAMAKRWKKGQDEVTVPASETAAAAPAAPAPVATEDATPLPESRVDDEEMNDES